MKLELWLIAWAKVIFDGRNLITPRGELKSKIEFHNDVAKCLKTEGFLPVFDEFHISSLRDNSRSKKSNGQRGFLMFSSWRWKGESLSITSRSPQGFEYESYLSYIIYQWPWPDFGRREEPSFLPLLQFRHVISGYPFPPTPPGTVKRGYLLHASF